jgi:outer membrane protein assembly factor BamA
LADENSLNTEIIQAGNFRARINNFGSAWLASYGTGIRTVLLGYYLKFDVAWPIEDYEIGSPKFYLTLGYDF